MRVRAIRDHFDGVLRKEGEEFEVTGKKLSKHVEKVPEKQPAAEPQGEEDATGTE